MAGLEGTPEKTRDQGRAGRCLDKGISELAEGRAFRVVGENHRGEQRERRRLYGTRTAPPPPVQSSRPLPKTGVTRGGIGTMQPWMRRIGVVRSGTGARTKSPPSRSDRGEKRSRGQYQVVRDF